MTVAASAASLRKTFGHLSHRFVSRRQSLSWPIIVLIRLRRLCRCLFWRTVSPRDFRQAMHERIPLSFNGPRNQSA